MVVVSTRQSKATYGHISDHGGASAHSSGVCQSLNFVVKDFLIDEISAKCWIRMTSQRESDNDSNG